MAMPFQWKGWSARPELTLRDTFYTQRCDHQPLDYTCRGVDNGINRKALEMAFELRPPALSRVFEHPWLGRKWKHVVEPRMRYDYVTGVNNFANILRFDATDILSNTNAVKYAIVNRIYAKRLNHEDENKDRDCGQAGMSALAIGGGPPSGTVPWERFETLKSQPCPTGPREVVTWEVAQKYYFDPTF